MTDVQSLLDQAFSEEEQSIDDLLEDFPEEKSLLARGIEFAKEQSPVKLLRMAEPERVKKLGRQVKQAVGTGLGAIASDAAMRERAHDYKSLAKLLKEPGPLRDLYDAGDLEDYPGFLPDPDTLDQKSEEEVYEDLLARSNAFIDSMEAFAESMPEIEEGNPFEGLGTIPELVGEAIPGVATFVPSMATTAISPAHGFQATVATVGGMTYKDLKKKGVAENAARDAAALSGFFSGALEYAGNLLQLKILFGAKGGKFVTDKISKVLAKMKIPPAAQKYIAKLFGGGVTEAVEEGLQQYPEAGAEVYAATYDQPLEVQIQALEDLFKSAEFKHARNHAMMVGGVGGGVLQAPGTMVGVGFDAFKWARDKYGKKPAPVVTEGEIDVTPEMMEGAELVEDLDAPFVESAKGLAGQVDRATEQKLKAQERAQAQRNTELRKEQEAQRRKTQNEELAQIRASQEQARRDAARQKEDQQRRDRQERQQWINIISNPTRLMNVAEEELSRVETEGNADAKAAIKPVRLAHKALATGVKSVEKLKSLQYDLKELLAKDTSKGLKAQTNFKVKSLADGLVQLLGDQAAHIERVEANRERLKAYKPGAEKKAALAERKAETVTEIPFEETPRAIPVTPEVEGREPGAIVAGKPTPARAPKPVSVKERLKGVKPKFARAKEKLAEKRTARQIVAEAQEEIVKTLPLGKLDTRPVVQEAIKELEGKKQPVTKQAITKFARSKVVDNIVSRELTNSYEEVEGLKEKTEKIANRAVDRLTKSRYRALSNLVEDRLGAVVSVEKAPLKKQQSGAYATYYFKGEKRGRIEIYPENIPAKFLRTEESTKDFVDKIIAHESLHALIDATIRLPSERSKPGAIGERRYVEWYQKMRKFIDELRKIAQEREDTPSRVHDLLAIMTDPINTEEIITYAFTSPRFAQWLSKIPATHQAATEYKANSMWRWLQGLITDLANRIGFKSKLDEIAEVMDEYLGVTVTPATQTKLARAEKAPKLSAKAQEITDQIMPMANKAVNALPTIVVDKQNELPRGAIKAVGEGNTIYATVHNNKVYLVAENLSGPQQALQKWMHEQVGHKGLIDTLVDNEIVPQDFFNTVHQTLAKTEQYADVKELYKQDIEGMSTQERRAFLVEEVLAQRSEDLDPTLRRKIWTKFVQAINKWLKALGVWVRITEADLEAILETAKNRVMFGEERAWLEFAHPHETYKKWVKDITAKFPKVRTWYENHQQLVKDTFGDDAVLFNALLALNSAGTKVRTNAQWAVDTYLYLAGAQFKPGGRFPNEVARVLENMMASPEGILAGISGSPSVKVSEFMRGLLGDNMATANDRWMYRAMFGPSKVTLKAAKEGKIADLDSKFLASENTAVRHKMFTLAKELTEETGETWTPRDVQAAIWTHVLTKGRGPQPGMIWDYQTALTASAPKFGGLSPIEHVNEMMGADKTQVYGGVKFKATVPIGKVHTVANVGKLPEGPSVLESKYQGWLEKQGVKDPRRYLRGPVVTGKYAKAAPSNFVQVNPATFIAERNKDPFLTQHSAEDLKKKKARLYMLPGQRTGYAIGSDGEIFNVFNNSGTNGLRPLAVIDAVINGGTWVNRLDTNANTYESLGFKQGKGTRMEFKGETYDPLIIAGMYEAAWNKRLDADRATAKVLNAISDRSGGAARRELGIIEPGEVEKRNKEYLRRNWATYKDGVNNTKTSTGINPVKNVLVTDSKAASRKGRVAMLQVSSLRMREEATDMGQSYYDNLYEHGEGYKRPADFWEIPDWVAQAAKIFPKSDVYVVRNIEEAKAFLSDSDYDAILVSALDSNKDFIKRIVEGSPDTDFIAGGYIDPSFFKENKNVAFKTKLQEAATALKVPYKEGVDYRHFKGTETVPRLTCSEGCLHKCAFCTIPKQIKMPGRTNILSQADSFKDLNYDLVYVNDKTYGQAPNYKILADVNKQIKKQNPEFKGFVIQTTAPAFNKMPDSFLRESGIKYVELGMESFNDDILQKINKPHRRKHIEAAVDKIRRLNMRFIPNVMVGLAGEYKGKKWTETAETYANTMDFLEANKDVISHTNTYVLAAYDGTATGEQLGTENVEDQDENVIAKSWLGGNPRLHEQFYQDVLDFSTEQLTGKPVVRTPVKFARVPKEVAQKYEEAKKKMGIPEKTPEERVSDFKFTMSDRIKRYWADNLYALKKMEAGRKIAAHMSGYKSFNLMSNLPQIIGAFLHNGRVRFENNWINVVPEKKGGLVSVMEDLGDQADDFFNRLTAKSANEMLKKGRKNLFGAGVESDAVQIKALMDGTQAAYEENQEAWDAAEERLRELNTSVLDFAEQSGLIDPDMRSRWERNYYIPFYRVIEDDWADTDIETLFPKSGPQIGRIFELKGSKKRIGDPMTNLINSYSYLLNESLKNLSRKKTLRVAQEAGLLEQTHKKMRGKRGVIDIRVKGVSQYYKVLDPAVYDAVMEIDNLSQGTLSKFLSVPKRMLTAGVTLAPGFRMANIFRDTIHTWVLQKDFTAFIDSARGFKHAFLETDVMKEFASTGGAFSGSYHERDIAAETRKGIEKLKKKIKRGKRAAYNPLRWWEIWNKIGEASENAARLGLYMKKRKKGATKFEAAYEAKDLLDFHRSGKGRLAAVMMQSIPFLNARIQGLYKLGRAGMEKETRRTFRMRAAILTVAALMLHAWNDDDERYQDLPDHEKMGYLHFYDIFKDGDHLRLPVPFELGSIFMVIPAGIWETVKGQRTAGEMGKLAWNIMVDTFRVDFPQIIKPAVQQWANKDFYTGLPIVTKYENKLDPQYQAGMRTSKIGKTLGKLTGISPKRLDQLNKDIFGTAGMTVAAAADWLIAHTQAFPEDPSAVFSDKYFHYGVGRFYREAGEVPRHIKAEQKFYDLFLENDGAWITYKFLIKQRRKGEARAYRKEERGRIKLGKRMAGFNKRIRMINQKIKLIASSRKYSAQEKREKIDKLLKKRHDTFKLSMDKIEKIKERM